MRPRDLVLSRDIRGDGRWSLHHPDTCARLLSGEALRIDNGDGWACWSRPNSADYRAATEVGSPRPGIRSLHPIVHDRNRYANGCRCDTCTAANREYMLSLRGKEPPTHGTPSAYRNYGCRCEVCAEAMHTQMLALRRSKEAKTT